VSARRWVIISSAGVTCYDADFYPYGTESNVINTCPQNYKFTGKERDTETGNDDFDARYYSSVYGRFLSADWSEVPAPVPYAKLTNPQTLNLYAIVRDNPETYADLDGHDSPSEAPNMCSGAWVCSNPAQNQNSTPPKETQEQHGRLWNFFHSLGLVHTEAEEAAIAHKSALNMINQLGIQVIDEHGNRVDPATLSTEQLDELGDQWMRGHCCLPG
jgi:RHS repeat-associated protein